MVTAPHLAELLYKAHREYRTKQNNLAVDILPTWLDLQTMSRNQLIAICQMVLDELEFEEGIRNRKPWN